MAGNENQPEHDPDAGASLSAEAPAGPEHTSEKAIAWLTARVADLENNWRTAVADLDNFRKRSVRDTAQVRQQERKRAAEELLTLLDNLDLALDHAEAEPGSIVAGVAAVRTQADAVMAKLGFPRRDVKPGTLFDPHLHEVVAAVPVAGAEPGTVVEAVRPGYGEADRQLRPAAVAVARTDP
jgi:molecular chaperone GrpE